MKLKGLLSLSMFVFLVIFLLPFGNAAHGAGQKRYQKTVVTYEIPDVTLINQEGRKVGLRSILASDKPVFLQFIYATCTTICPVLSAGYSNLQRKLGPEVKNVRFVSISIDPEHDTPEVMKEYLERYNAKPGWEFLTGPKDDIDRVMKAFDAYVTNKMAHYPLTLLRSPSDGKWVRLYGLMSTQNLMEEYRKIWQRD